tara:strand:- start:1993 stop:2625 length:633 start_codon:yes stop_codon:yes gene_type:complete
MASAFLIGLEIPKRVIDKTKKLKRFVADSLGEQHEVNTEPHITLNINNFDSVDAIDKTLEETCAKFKQMHISLEGISIFPRKSGESAIVHESVEPKSQLRKLQRAISIAVNPFRVGENVKEYYDEKPSMGTLTIQQLKTSKRYGYPFIGSTWTPHLTIAIVDGDKFEDIKEAIMARSFIDSFLLRKITLFYFDHDIQNWKPLKKYNLIKQ